MQLPGSQNPDTVRQSETTVTILRPTQALTFRGDLNRKVITLQDFQQEKMEQRLLTNLYIPKHMNSPTEGTKKYFSSKLDRQKCFQVQHVYL